MRVWVCANCGEPIEPFFPQDYFDEGGIRCPGSDPGCSPRADRALLTEQQVKAIEIREEGHDRDASLGRTA